MVCNLDQSRSSEFPYYFTVCQLRFPTTATMRVKCFPLLSDLIPIPLFNLFTLMKLPNLFQTQLYYQQNGDNRTFLRELLGSKIKFHSLLQIFIYFQYQEGTALSTEGYSNLWKRNSCHRFYDLIEEKQKQQAHKFHGLGKICLNSQGFTTSGKHQPPSSFTYKCYFYFALLSLLRKKPFCYDFIIATKSRESKRL